MALVMLDSGIFIESVSLTLGLLLIFLGPHPTLHPFPAHRIDPYKLHFLFFQDSFNLAGFSQ